MLHSGQAKSEVMMMCDAVLCHRVVVVSCTVLTLLV
jgi:hypothetical protein